MNFKLIAALAAGAAVTAGGLKVAAQNTARDVKADPAAVELLREAHDQRETFPPGFAGLSAKLTVNDAGEATGTFDLTSNGEVKVKLENATKEQTQWAQDELESSFDHRRADDFSKGDGSNPITFDSDDHSPLGRQVALNDKGNSHYRIREGHISQVNRAMGPSMKFSITMMADKTLPDGKYLPSQFTVTVFDSAGAIKQVDMYTDTYKQVGDVWVPNSRRIITANSSGFSAKSFKLADIKLTGK